MLMKNASFRDKIRENISRTLWKLLLGLENRAGDDAASNGEYAFLDKWALFQMNRQPTNERVITFDVGGNQGEYTQAILDACQRHSLQPEIHAFEPSKDGLAHLRKRFAGKAEVLINAQALSDESGMRSLYFDHPLSGFASLHERDDVLLKHHETIETQRLDTYLDHKGIAHIHLLKMDIEGHELAALKGLGEKLDPAYIDFIQFEYGGANLDAGTSLKGLFSLLERRGFRLARVLPSGLAYRTYKPWLETYQHGNFVAINPLLKFN